MWQLTNYYHQKLGSGLGLNGILTWRMTTDSSVFITDGDTDALALLRQNIERNRPLNEDEDNMEICCNQLIWGKESSTDFLEHKSKGKRFDVLIASDIIYAECIIEPLWQTVDILLSREGGIFVMAFARRKVPVSKEHVLESADKAGFQYELVREDTDEGIWIYIFRYKDKEDSKLCVN